MTKYLVAIPIALSFTACGFTQSALDYSKEGTARVNAGYLAKENMTKHLVEYLKVANKDCGVKVEIIDNKPVTTVKKCVDVEDVMASVDRVKIVEPQQIKDIAQSAGDFIVKATSLAVPFASIYYGSKNHEVTANANVAMNASDNQADTSIFGSYANNFQNTVTNTEYKDVSNTSSSEISNVVNDVTTESIKDYSNIRTEEVVD